MTACIADLLITKIQATHLPGKYEIIARAGAVVWAWMAAGYYRNEIFNTASHVSPGLMLGLLVQGIFYIGG